MPCLVRELQRLLPHDVHQLDHVRERSCFLFRVQPGKESADLGLTHSNRKLVQHRHVRPPDHDFLLRHVHTVLQPALGLRVLVVGGEFDGEFVTILHPTCVFGLGGDWVDARAADGVGATDFRSAALREGCWRDHQGDKRNRLVHQHLLGDRCSSKNSYSFQKRSLVLLNLTSRKRGKRGCGAYYRFIQSINQSINGLPSSRWERCRLLPSEAARRRS
mmetsp:Transcript_17820/g.44571  ORF Transcript_17820/g.44571 Transcript_17820/m.44571 type:complete len:218 (+) Transcript_17820:461-1114(+)